MSNWRIEWDSISMCMLLLRHSLMVTKRAARSNSEEDLPLAVMWKVLPRIEKTQRSIIPTKNEMRGLFSQPSCSPIESFGRLLLMMVYALKNSRIADRNWFRSATAPEKCSSTKPPDADKRSKVKGGKTELSDSIIESAFDSYGIRINSRQDIVINVS